jgi:hypothetical protein
VGRAVGNGPRNAYLREVLRERSQGTHPELFLGRRVRIGAGRPSTRTVGYSLVEHAAPPTWTVIRSPVDEGPAWK